MQYKKLKLLILLLGMVLSMAWCWANGTNTGDGYSHITVQEGHVQGVPGIRFSDPTGIFLSLLPNLFLFFNHISPK